MTSDPLPGIGKSQDSASDDLHSHERMLINLDYVYSDSDDSD